MNSKNLILGGLCLGLMVACAEQGGDQATAVTPEPQPVQSAPAIASDSMPDGNGVASMANAMQGRLLAATLSAPASLKYRLDGNRIQVSWPEVAGATAYRLRWSSESGEKTIQTSSAHFQHKLADLNSKYRYRVASVNNGVTGYYSAVLIVDPAHQSVNELEIL